MVSGSAGPDDLPSKIALLCGAAGAGGFNDDLLREWGWSVARFRTARSSRRFCDATLLDLSGLERGVLIRTRGRILRDK